MATAARLDLPWPLDPAFTPIAVTLLQGYFWGGCGPRFTGAHFERLGGGGDRPSVAYEFTAEDLVAMTMLSVEVPATAASHPRH